MKLFAVGTALIVLGWVSYPIQPQELTPIRFEGNTLDGRPLPDWVWEQTGDAEATELTSDLFIVTSWRGNAHVGGHRVWGRIFRKDK